MPPQTVIVSCPGGYDLDLNYGVGPRSGVLAFTLALIGAIFSFVGFALLGTFLLVRSHRRTPHRLSPAGPQDTRPQDT